MKQKRSKNETKSLRNVKSFNKDTILTFWDDTWLQKPSERGHMAWLLSQILKSMQQLGVELKYDLGFLITVITDNEN